MSDFDIQIQQWVEKSKVNLDTFLRAFVLKLVTRIKLYTPVETGRLRASIQPMTDLASWDTSKPILIGTNLEYAPRIEYGFVGEDALGRRYHQVGAAMFTRAAQDADEIAEEVAQELAA